MTRYSPVGTILTGGTIAGIGDITYAIIFSVWQLNIPPVRLLQTVATGILGSAAYDGGWLTAAFGLALHFLIAYLLAALFYVASRRFIFLILHPVISGVLFGIGVFLIMKLIVLPLSAFPYPISFKPLSTITNLLSHIFLFGVPIALTIKKFSPKVSSSA